MGNFVCKLFQHFPKMFCYKPACKLFNNVANIKFFPFLHFRLVHHDMSTISISQKRLNASNQLELASLRGTTLKSIRNIRHVEQVSDPIIFKWFFLVVEKLNLKLIWLNDEFILPLSHVKYNPSKAVLLLKIVFGFSVYFIRKLMFSSFLFSSRERSLIEGEKMFDGGE